MTRNSTSFLRQIKWTGYKISSKNKQCQELVYICTCIYIAGHLIKFATSTQQLQIKCYFQI